MRELEEETGYKAEGVLEVSPLMVCDPGTFGPHGLPLSLLLFRTTSELQTQACPLRI